MSRLLARIMLALLMIPLAVMVYVAVVVTLMNVVYGFSNEVSAFVITTVVVWGFVAAYWTMLWRRTVRWNRRRIGLTIAAGGAAVPPGVIAGALVSFNQSSFGVFVGGVIMILVWLIATVLIWRETTAERIERIRARSGSVLVCPGCGYNMTGLRQTTCPECGTSYTIDELAALQPGREEL